MRGSVFATFGVVSDEALEGRADKSKCVGELQQLQESAIPDHQPEVAINQREALVDEIKRGLQGGMTRWRRHVVSVFTWIGHRRHRNGVSP